MAEQIHQSEMRILELANGFKCLRRAPGIHGGLWDAMALDDWASSGASSGEKHSVRFVLGVWDPSHKWQSGNFNIFDAIEVWDETHREPFLKWAREPWFA